MARQTKKRSLSGTRINHKHNQQSNKRKVTRTGKRSVMTGGSEKKPPEVNRSQRAKAEVLAAMHPVGGKITFEEEVKMPLSAPLIKKGIRKENISAPIPYSGPIGYNIVKGMTLKPVSEQKYNLINLIGNPNKVYTLQEMQKIAAEFNPNSVEALKTKFSNLDTSSSSNSIKQFGFPNNNEVLSPNSVNPVKLNKVFATNPLGVLKINTATLNKQQIANSVSLLKQYTGKNPGKLNNTTRQEIDNFLNRASTRYSELNKKPAVKAVPKVITAVSAFQQKQPQVALPAAVVDNKE